MDERACFLSQFQRIDSTRLRLNRIGFIWDKSKLIDRLFDHYSFSFIISGDGFVEKEGRRVALKAPLLMINRPGEEKCFGPDTVWLECFLAYDAGQRDRLEAVIGPELLLASQIPIYDLETVRGLVAIMDRKSRPLLQHIVPDQLDRLAETLLLTARCDRGGERMPDWECKVSQFAQYLEANFKCEIDFEKLSARFGLSYSAIRKYWRRKFGFSPYRYLMELRLRQATGLLSGSYLSIGDVAAESGFSDQRYFSRFFRNMVGTTPGEYRKRKYADVSGK